MSKDMLGSVVRAAVGVPQESLGLLAMLASKLSVHEPRERTEGEVWRSYLQDISGKGLPDSAYLLGVQVTETNLGEFDVNYDTDIRTLLVESEIGRAVFVNGLAFWDKSRKLSQGSFGPVQRTGTVRYRARSIQFDASLPKSVIGFWISQRNQLMAGSKEGIALAVASSPLTLASSLPLVMFGETRYNAHEFSFSPILREHNGRLGIEHWSYDERSKKPLWGSGWRFLSLEEIAPAT